MTAQPTIAPLRCIRRAVLITSPSPITVSTATRTLSTSTPLSRQTPSHRTVPADLVPEYPYGRFETYKQRNEGLYGRSKIRFGNVVAVKYKNKARTTWLPNRHTKRLWSPSLHAFIRTRMTASVLHTIDRLGGIDEYLLGSKAKRIKELGPAGWALRWKIMQTDAVRARFARERAALGLPPKNTADASAFPAELAAEGLSADAVLDEVDAMLEREDEFVIGDPAAEAEDPTAAEERRDTTQQVQKPE
ncbi:hypothetical protein E0Z10_g8910 [Xylaria hypoxylon]|uniref:Ribosomal protein L28 n=1 Tax=Xylaria hypoxylon TaxID=37992 RepID=A0A4Z0YMJ4_9PEZI|nr:hypothetical protein E0Z10_g8910 [Xylaria hypoxylon]